MLSSSPGHAPLFPSHAESQSENQAESSSSSTSSPSAWWHSTLRAVSSLSVSPGAGDPLDDLFFSEDHPPDGPNLTQLELAADIPLMIDQLRTAMANHRQRLQTVHTLNILPSYAQPGEEPVVLDATILNAIVAAFPSLQQLAITAEVTFSADGARTLAAMSQLRALTINIRMPLRNGSSSPPSSSIPSALDDFSPLVRSIGALSELNHLTLYGQVRGACDMSLLNSLTHLHSLDLRLFRHSADGDVSSVLSVEDGRLVLSANRSTLTHLRLGPITCANTHQMLALLPSCAPHVKSLVCCDTSNNVVEGDRSLLLEAIGPLTQLTHVEIDFSYPPTDSLRETPILKYFNQLSDNIQVLAIQNHMRITDTVLQALSGSGASGGRLAPSSSSPPSVSLRTAPHRLRALHLWSSYGYSSNGIRALHSLPLLCALSVSLDHQWHRHLSGGSPAQPPPPTTDGDHDHDHDRDHQLYSCFRNLSSCVELVIGASRPAGQADYLLTPAVLPQNILCLGATGCSGAPPAQASDQATQEDEPAAVSLRRLVHQWIRILSECRVEGLHRFLLSSLQLLAQKSGHTEWWQQWDDWLATHTTPHRAHHAPSGYVSAFTFARFNQPQIGREQALAMLNELSQALTVTAPAA